MGWKQIGQDAGYKDTIAAVAMNGRIYTIDSRGTLWVTSSDGSYQELGESYQNTKFLMASEGKLYTIEEDDEGYKVVKKYSVTWTKD